MKSLPRILFSCLLASTCATAAFAQSVVTNPVGFVTLSIAAGGGTSRTLTPLSIPLLADSTAHGQLVGQITGSTSTTITNSNAGWTTGELSTAASPSVIKITSGTFSGRTFLVSVSTANTDQTLTVDTTDLVSTDLSGLQVGDTYQIFSCDTIANLFGTPDTTGILGGANAASADNLILSVNGIFSVYYYNTGLGRWTKSALGNPDGSNAAIRPDAGVSFNRLGNTAINLTVFGDVPSLGRQVAVVNSGLTYLAQGWPADIKLVDSHIQNMPNWVSGSSPATSDTVRFLVSGSFRVYWFDGTNWRRQALGSPISDSDVVSVGSSMIINKRGTLSGASVLTQNLPYALN